MIAGNAPLLMRRLELRDKLGQIFVLALDFINFYKGLNMTSFA